MATRDEAAATKAAAGGAERPLEGAAAGSRWAWFVGDLEAWRRGWTGPAGAVAFAVVVVLVLAATVATWAAHSDYQVWSGTPRYLLIMSTYFAIMLGVRAVVSRRLPRLPVLLDIVAVLLLMSALAAGYTALKVQVPLLNGANFDAQMATADRILGLGIDPNVFLVSVFAGGPPWLAGAVDTYYFYFVTLFVIFAGWFLTDPRQDHRVAFAAGWIVVWAAGAVMYVALPVRGPVYFTRDLWHDVAQVFPFAAQLQAALFQNYTALVGGETRHIVHEYGIAAMPSLHVATHAYLWLWARNVGARLAPLFLAMMVATWFASVATGWHWAVDGLVGLLLAWAAARMALALLRRPASSAAHETAS